MAANHMERVERPVASFSWLKRVVRYVLHLFVFYQVARFSAAGLVDFAYGTFLPAIQQHHPGGSDLQFFFSHIFAFTLAPSLLAGLIINARFRHGAACWVWAFPVGILAIVFVFAAPGMYPTMILESNFGQAFHHFFGAVSGIPPITGFKDMAGYHDWWRVHDQLRYTVPAYAGVAYSLGAWLGMSQKARWLQAFMERL